MARIPNVQIETPRESVVIEQIITRTINRTSKILENLRSRLEALQILKTNEELYSFLSLIQTNIVAETRIVSHQNINIDATTEPYIPERFDMALVYGVVSEYKPELRVQYENELNNIKTEAYELLNDSQRITKILNKVNIELSKLNIKVVSLYELLEKANLVQQKILLATNIIEFNEAKPITIDSDPAIPERFDSVFVYGILAEYSQNFMPVFASEITFIKTNAYERKLQEPNRERKENRLINIFNRVYAELETFGIPKVSDVEIIDKMQIAQTDIILTTQIVTKNNIGSIVDINRTPILPEICDNALIYGVLYHYKPEYKAIYDEEIKNIKANAYDYKLDSKKENILLNRIYAELELLNVPKVTDEELFRNITIVQNNIQAETNILQTFAIPIFTSDSEFIFPEYATNAILYGLIAIYLPPYKSLYDNEIKLIKMNCYEEPTTTNERLNKLLSRLHYELSNLFIPKVWDNDLLKIMNSVQANIIGQTNIVRPEANIVITLDNPQIMVTELCDNALFYGTLASFIPNNQVMFENEIKIIKMNCYAKRVEATRVDTIFNTIYQELRTLNIPKIWDDIILLDMFSIQKNIIAETNIVRTLPISPDENLIVPQVCDNALVYGILANYNGQKYLPLYQQELTNIRTNAYEKHTEKLNRTKNILNNLYVELKKLNIKKVWDDELIVDINKVQNEILTMTRTGEVSIPINIQSGQESIIIEDLMYYQIRDLVSLTDKYNLNFVNIESWSELAKNNEVGQPLYVTMMNNEMFFYPTPNADCQLVMIGFKKTAIEPISLTNEPELNNQSDEVIELGVMAKYDKPQYELFLKRMQELKELKIRYNGKTLFNNQVESNW